MSRKTINPNASPIKKIVGWFGLYCRGGDKQDRTADRYMLLYAVLCAFVFFGHDLNEVNQLVEDEHGQFIQYEFKNVYNLLTF